MFEGLEGGRSANGRSGLRPGPAGRGPHAQRQEDRRRQGRRDRDDRGFIPSTSRCAPTCRTSSPSATSSASPCWRTRRCTRRMWRPSHRRLAAGQQESAAFDARVIPSVAYTDPEVAWVGLTEDQAKAQGIKVKKGLFPWTAPAAPSPTAATKASPSCCSTSRGRPRQDPRRRHRRHACRRHDRRDRAGHRDGRDAVDIGKTIHPHPRAV